MAYLDTRDKDHVVIQFISLYDRRKSKKPSLYAKLYYNDSLSSSPCISTKWTVGSPSENYAKNNGEDDFIHYLISTTDVDSPQRRSLLYATVSTDSYCMNESARISIQTIETNKTRYTYGVCLHKALLGNVKPQVLLDWVKLNIAMGAEIITLYIQTVPESLPKILKPYISKGVVDLIDWKVEQPFADSPSSHGGQTGVIAECIYYNMNRVKYLGLMDLDEFIVPQKHNSVQELLREVETNERAKVAASYQILSANVYDNGKPLPDIAEKCPEISDTSIPVYFKRIQTCVAGSNYLRKLIVKPIAVTTSWVHNILAFQSSYTKEYVISSDLVRSNHYRSSFKGGFPCSSKNETTLTMSRFFANVTGCSH